MAEAHPSQTLVYCPDCGAAVRPWGLRQHQRKAHGRVFTVAEAKSAAPTAQGVPGSGTEPTGVHPTLILKGHRPPIRLLSHRGTRTSGHGCGECGSTRDVFRYAESNYGETFICQRCKPKVFDRSFGGRREREDLPGGRRDLLDTAYQGGGCGGR